MPFTISFSDTMGVATVTASQPAADTYTMSAQGSTYECIAGDPSPAYVVASEPED